jgi:NAD(P)H-quinone oxidoreductase subunit 5
MHALPALPMLVAVLYLFAGCMAPISHRSKRSDPWRLGHWATRLANLFGFSSLLLFLLLELPESALDHWWAPRLDLAALVMLSLVSFIGWVLHGFAQRYLIGEPHQGTFQRWFLWTLAATSLLAVADHMALFALGWIASGLSVHRLMLFYPHRHNAVLAAHKKFLVIRLADLCLLAALAMLVWRFDTLSISQALSQVSHGDALVSWSAGLLVAAALIKCAQMPLHGWLLQVMEAPTPVSALLHAGVVNLGGFLLIVFAPVLMAAPLAQGVLLVLASLSTVLAALIMSTRVSIKVMLAWSTCAQMGFLLIECALGAWSLALMHLVGHSCYKAYQFLASGESVMASRAYRLMHASRGGVRPGSWWPLLLAVLGLASTAGWVLLSSAHWPAAVFLAAALMALASEARLAAYPVLRTIGLLSLFTAFYLGLHSLLEWLSASQAPAETPAWAMAVMVAAVICLLLLYLAMRLGRAQPLLQRLYPWCYGGLFVDEWLTRWTMRLWPVRLPANPAPFGSNNRPRLHTPELPEDPL